MILKALYDYYGRCGSLPAPGMEEKEFGFILVISKEGQFVRIEDCRTGKQQGRVYLVKKHVGRSSGVVANYLYDNSTYVLGYADLDKEATKLEERLAKLQNKNAPLSDIQDAQKKLEDFRNKRQAKEKECMSAFIDKTVSIYHQFPDDEGLQALCRFYEQDKNAITSAISRDPLWEEIKKNLSKKYSVFSFRIDGERKIIAERQEILQLEDHNSDTEAEGTVCLITGHHGAVTETTTATMIPGSQATAKLVSFQINSGYDSYGKKKCGNAPISQEAEFAYTTALNALLQRGSHNKFGVGNRTFVFWASAKSEAATQTEESLFDLLGYTEEESDNPNEKIEQVRKVFQSVCSGYLRTNLDDRFYILGLAPNSARIAVVYWQDDSLKKFASRILRHFDDMEIVDTRKEKHPYMGLKNMLSAVTLGGKQSDATPNLPEAVVKSIFQGLPYPYTLFSACIRRVRAETGDGKKDAVNIARAAILKACLNRKSNNNNVKIKVMLDTCNTNPGYLCGRLFAVLEKIQRDASGIVSIRERYMNAASATPSAVFATILNLSAHHLEKLSNEGQKVFYEKLKQEIIDKIPASGFPAHLDLQDQGRFFIGYYHQRQDFFKKKETGKD